MKLFQIIAGTLLMAVVALWGCSSSSRDSSGGAATGSVRGDSSGSGSIDSRPLESPDPDFPNRPRVDGVR